MSKANQYAEARSAARAICPKDLDCGTVIFKVRTAPDEGNTHRPILQIYVQVRQPDGGIKYAYNGLSVEQVRELAVWLKETFGEEGEQ